MSRTGERNAAYMREYRAKKRMQLDAMSTPRPVALLPPTEPAERDAAAGPVECAVQAELELIGTEKVPGLAAVAVALARLMDNPALTSSSVAGQLRVTLADIRAASAGASRSGRMAALRGSVSSLKESGGW